MNFEFDIFGKIQAETPILCDYDGSEMDIVGKVINQKGQIRANDISTLTFTVPLIDGINNECYSNIVTRRKIKFETLGVFIIEKVSESVTDTKSMKHVTVKSLEYELTDKDIDYLEGTFQLYNKAKPENTLLYHVLEYVPNWSLGEVDVGLISKYRTFSIEGDLDVYNFLTGEMSQAYDCIVEFDTFNRVINVREFKNVINKTDVIISHNNLAKEISIDENSDSLYTALNVYGEDGVDIVSVNPLGTNIIYNFNHYIETGGIGEGLAKSIRNWEEKISNVQQEYANKMVELKNKNAETLIISGIIDGFEMQIASLKNIEDSRREQGLDIRDVLIEKEKIESKIQKEEEKLSVIETKIEILQDEIKSITEDCSFENNFTEEQLHKLDGFIVDGSYDNEWFVVTDSMAEKDKKDIMLELYNDAQTALKKLSKPSYSFKLNSVNLLALKQFQALAQEFDLYSEVVIKKSDEVFFQPCVIGYDFDFENEGSFNISFSNILRQNDDEYAFSEIFSDVSKGSRSALSSSRSASMEANYALEKSINALYNSNLANTGVYEVKFDLKDFGKKIVEAERSVEVLEDLIARKQEEWDRIGEITDDLGNVIAGKLVGDLETSIVNILSDSGRLRILGNGIMAHNEEEEILSNKATLLNGSGLLVASSKNADGTWNWTTAIDGDGINASLINTGELNAVDINGVNIMGSNITGGKITGVQADLMEINSASIKALDLTASSITGGEFTGATFTGNEFIGGQMHSMIMTAAEITGAVITGTSTITGATINGSQINGGALDIGNGKFRVNEYGELRATDATISGGELNINNNFRVNRYGECRAVGLEVVGGELSATTIKASTIDGGMINGSAINIGDGKFIVDKQGNCIAKSFKMIDGALEGEIEVDAAIFNGGIYKTWREDVNGAQLDNDGLRMYHGLTQIGSYGYTNENTGGNPDAMIVESMNGYALKFSSDGDMSISGKNDGDKVYMGDTVFTGSVVGVDGSPITGGSALKSLEYYTDGFVVNGNNKFKWVEGGLKRLDDGVVIPIKNKGVAIS